MRKAWVIKTFYGINKCLFSYAFNVHVVMNLFAQGAHGVEMGSNEFEPKEANKRLAA